MSSAPTTSIQDFIPTSWWNLMYLDHVTLYGLIYYSIISNEKFLDPELLSVDAQQQYVDEIH